MGLCECVLHKMISCETGFSADNILQKHLLVTGSWLMISRRKNLEHLNRSLINHLLAIQGLKSIGVGSTDPVSLLKLVFFADASESAIKFNNVLK